MTEPAISLTELSSTDTSLTLRLRGACTVVRLEALQKALDPLPKDSDIVLEVSGVERLDTAGAWALINLAKRLEREGHALRFEGASDNFQSLIETVENAYPEPDLEPEKPLTITDRLDLLGRKTVAGWTFLSELMAFLGLFLARLFRSILRPSEFRLTALVHHCEAVGVQAVPIVSLMAFLIGVVLAFQGSTQLQQFGAEVFVVDLIAISILRELGILLTAIIVAGRTASAFTAAIGSMKMREEIDAMETLSLDPAMMLFVPRILALLLMLPILGLIADVMGLLGGALMAWADLGISPAMFTTRLVEGTDVKHVIVGLIKAPFFAVTIGVVGCHAGMKVKSNAESLGRQTSAAVVTAIFAVIVIDAMFSIFFAEMGY